MDWSVCILSVTKVSFVYEFERYSIQLYLMMIVVPDYWYPIYFIQVLLDFYDTNVTNVVIKGNTLLRKCHFFFPKTYKNKIKKWAPFLTLFISTIVKMLSLMKLFQSQIFKSSECPMPLYQLNLNFVILMSILLTWSKSWKTYKNSDSRCSTKQLCWKLLKRLILCILGSFGTVHFWNSNVTKVSFLLLQGHFIHQVACTTH